MSDPTPTETELKIPVPDLDSVRQRLADSNAREIHAAEREVNVLFDSADGDMTRADRVLRLRRMGRARRLTLKGPPRFEGQIKHREELELEVGDVETMAAILDRLGFQPTLRYEKDRETWEIHGVTVTLDHTPMGDFVELEGAADRLAAAAESIGVAVADAVRGSYISLWQEYRAQNPGLDLPTDMVFPS
jgi:adenylate cyclase class 2